MILHPIDMGFALVGAVVAAWLLWSWGRARRVVARIRSQPTARAADVTEGPVELAGKITVAGEPLTSLEGVAVAAYRRGVTADYEDSDSRGTLLEKVMTAAVELEVEDASGSCILELDEMVLLGPRTTYTFTAAACEAQHPEIWALVRREIAAGNRIVSVRVEETTLPDGVTGFVSGFARPSDRIDASAGGYRGGARRLKVTGTADHLLIAAAWKEEEVLAFLEGPLGRTLGMAAVVLLVVGAAIAVPLLLGAHARV